VGDLAVRTHQELQRGDAVSVSVRPEDVELSETPPEGLNVWPATVDQKVFLGEAVDFQVKVGPRVLLSRRHPTLRTKVGEPIWVQLSPEKCVVLRSEASGIRSQTV
jgi:iron(III) transport system ATP-binding protein